MIPIRMGGKIVQPISVSIRPLGIYANEPVEISLVISTVSEEKAIIVGNNKADAERIFEAYYDAIAKKKPIFNISDHVA